MRAPLFIPQALMNDILARPDLAWILPGVAAIPPMLEMTEDSKGQTLPLGERERETR
jgi:hypothetical protein